MEFLNDRDLLLNMHLELKKTWRKKNPKSTFDCKQTQVEVDNKILVLITFLSFSALYVKKNEGFQKFSICLPETFSVFKKNCYHSISFCTVLEDNTSFIFLFTLL